MTPTLALLFTVASLGALDTLWHHEWKARLPTRPGAERELRLHAARDLVYGVLFLALGWGHPAGALAWLLALLLAFEIVVTLVDFIEEDRNRPLVPAERVLHTLIAIVYGAFLAHLVPQLWGWAGQPTAYRIEAGTWSWVFTLLSAGVVGSGVRDLWAARGLAAEGTG